MFHVTAFGKILRGTRFGRIADFAGCWNARANPAANRQAYASGTGASWYEMNAIAIDATEGIVRSRAGTSDTGRRAVEWAKEAVGRGAGEILLTSIDADGTRSGYDLELTAAVAEAVTVPVIASGGAGSAAHVAAALEVAQAALLASILHEDPARLASLRRELREHGVAVRDAA